ncbi:MAG: cytoplasmic chaperone TorD [Firmicutes bacterium]|nr:cytoplasmic chaperone TorD [Bacillota bacterium]
MDKTLEYAELISNRERLYRFLGRLYEVEVDKNLLEQITAMIFPVECGEEVLNQGYLLLKNYIMLPLNDPVNDLAVDFARIFLGAGIVGDEVAYPYESVYTSPKRLIMQDSRDQVLAVYRNKGLNKTEGLDIPEDHIALELEFMAHLCQETQQAVAAQDWKAVSACLKGQLEFLTAHLLNWVPAFCTDIEKYAETEFYQAVAKITNGYLHLELDILEDMIADCCGNCA